VDQSDPEKAILTPLQHRNHGIHRRRYVVLSLPTRERLADRLPDAFYAIHRAHPDYEYAALVRSEEKSRKVQAAYPDVRIVIGGLDDSAILEEEAAKADIVLRIVHPAPYSALN
jgi:hypothetical protein